MTLKTTFVSLRDGTQIAVPDDITKMSHFVLREQGDWFEDEIHFVRRYVEPGMRALDIGANYGLYACAVLKKLNGQGHLWCFEPTPDTANALRQSFEQNGFQDQVTLIEAGLSNQEGTATFYTSPNSELNSLTKVDGLKQEDAFTIRLMTLDACLKEFKWDKLDFIKMDAEGEEIKILEAGKETLRSLSPLVMFELKHGDGINHGLIQAFEALDFGIYRLIPGLNTLVPVVVERGFDGYQLNLFACRPDRAEQLKAQGLLVELAPALPSTAPLQREQLPGLEKYTNLKLTTETTSDEVYLSMLSSFLAAQDQNLPMQQRYQHLLFAYDSIKSQLDAKEARIEHLASMARIAFDFGARHLGLAILESVVNRHFKSADPIMVRDAFVQPGKPMEALPVKGNPVPWLCAGVLDALIRKHAWSCYFSGPKMIPFMQKLEQTEYLHPDIAQRIATLKMGIQAAQQRAANQ